MADEFVIYSWNRRSGGRVDLNGKVHRILPEAITPQPHSGTNCNGWRIFEVIVGEGKVEGYPSIASCLTAQEVKRRAEAKKADLAAKKDEQSRAAMATMTMEQLIAIANPDAVGDQATKAFRELAMASPEEFGKARRVEEVWNGQHPGEKKVPLGFSDPWIARKDLTFVGVLIERSDEGATVWAIFELPEYLGMFYFCGTYEVIREDALESMEGVSYYTSDLGCKNGFTSKPVPGGICFSREKIVLNERTQEFVPSSKRRWIGRYADA